MKHRFLVVWSPGKGWHIESNTIVFPNGPIQDEETGKSFYIDAVSENIRDRDVFLGEELDTVLRQINNGD